MSLWSLGQAGRHCGISCPSLHPSEFCSADGPCFLSGCAGFWCESGLEASGAGEGPCDPRAAAAAAAVAAGADTAAGASSSCGGARCRQLPGERSLSAGCLKAAQAAAPSRTSVTLGSRVGGLHPAPLLLASRAAGCSTDLGQRAPWPGGQAAREAGRL